MRSALSIAVGLAAGLASVSPAAGQATTKPSAEPAAVLLEKGIYTEETAGDLDAAMNIYRQIAEDARAARPFAAQALYRLAMCQLKKGDKPAVVKELRELLAAYPQEKEIAAQAQRELAKLVPAGQQAFIPDADTKDEPIVLDLATCEMLPQFPKEQGLAYYSKLGKGDLAFDDGVLICIRGAKVVLIKEGNMVQPEPLPAGGAVGYRLGEKDDHLIVETAEQTFDVVILGYEKGGIRIHYKPYTAAAPTPRVVQTTPKAFANDVDPALDKITVTFDRPMMDKSWSWTMYGQGETFPTKKGEPSYDFARQTCSLPVKLQPGKVYWVGINGPGNVYFQTADHVAAPPYVILFATRTADGKPTVLPEDLVAQVKTINAAGAPGADKAKETAEAFLAALAAGDDAKAVGMMEPEKARPEGAKLRQSFDLSKAQIVKFDARQGNAYAVTNFFPAREGETRQTRMAMGIALRQQGDRWLVRDIDALPNEQAAEEYIRSFYKAFPADDALKARLINWVEKFFSENYRDITARKTLAWGEPESTPAGNLSIRYKYLATIWNKDKQIIDQRFTFAPDGKFVSAETIEKHPLTQPATSSTDEQVRRQVLALLAEAMQCRAKKQWDKAAEALNGAKGIQPARAAEFEALLAQVGLERRGAEKMDAVRQAIQKGDFQEALKLALEARKIASTPEVDALITQCRAALKKEGGSP